VRERTYQQLDLDYVCGTTLVAESLVEKIKAGHGHHLNTIDDIEVIEFRAGAGVEGKRIAEIELERRFRIFAVTRGRTSHVPDADMVLHEGDIIFGSIKDEAYPKIERYMGE
jgi:trk system potassium uptake protein TrkA